MKTCNQCKVEKPLTDYYRDKSRIDGLMYRCKVCTKQGNTKYYEQNREKVRQSQRETYKQNTEKIKANYLEWKKANPEYYKNWCNGNKERLQEYHKEYYLQNRATKKEYCKKWTQENREHVNNYAQKRRSEHPLEHRYRNLLRRVLTKQASELSLELGYTQTDLQHHLEQFNLDWKTNHIDHKVPVSWFKKEASINIVNSLENLQVIPAQENLEKGNKFSHPITQDYYELIKEHIKKKYIDKLEVM